ncbi:unnamed protein product [Cylicostephanus goldi]|uniref:Uncharacterized protein n=1 Tax=Cylicostephanus goldi TaxID=71465 RepID=A0A3P6PZT4_CYLGO|nr:unnamed protein product [Cylicostephanus goldi]
MATLTQTPVPMSHDNGIAAQDANLTDNAMVLPKQDTTLFPLPTSLPILKDHFDVEAAPRTLLPNAEVSLFGAGDVDASEQEPADFDRMVFRKYGSTDGRLEDDEEGTSMKPDRQKVVLPARKDSKFKEFKNPDEEAAVVKRILEEVCPPSALRVNSPPRPIENEAAVVKRILAEVCPLSSLPAHSSSSAMPTKEDGTAETFSNSRKRQPYKKRTKGRAKTIKKEENEYVPDLEKAGRPRGRPKKNGATSTPRTNRKSFDRRFAMSADRHGRPRRAASMIQDFLELYAKVDLCDLEEVHARATTFVRMLVDEYATTSKEVAKKSPIKQEARSSFEGNDGEKVNGSSASLAEGCSNCMDTDFKHEEMDVAMDTNANDDESIDEAGSSGENVVAHGDESNTEGEAEGHVGVAGFESVKKELPDNFIDSIPVLRGAALQAVPTSADSVLR